MSDLPSATWLAVYDEVVAGLGHAMNNRLAAVSSIARVLEYQEAGDSSLNDALLQEVDALEDTVRLLGLLARTSADGKELVRLQDLLPSVARLHGLRAGMRDLGVDLECNESVPPVIVDSVYLSRALLIGMGPVSRAARAASGSRVVMRCVADDGVLIRISGQDLPDLRQKLDLGELEAARIIAGEAGAHLQEMRAEEGSFLGLQLRLTEA